MVAGITATFGTNASRWFANKIFLQKILFVHLLPVKKNETRAIYARVSSFWWTGVDSNHRKRSWQIYSLLPLATREPVHI